MQLVSALGYLFLAWSERGSLGGDVGEQENLLARDDEELKEEKEGESSKQGRGLQLSYACTQHCLIYLYS